MRVRATFQVPPFIQHGATTRMRCKPELFEPRTMSVRVRLV